MGLLGVHIVWTVLTFAVFVAILVWAYSGGARRGFEAAARLPFEDDAGEDKDPPLPLAVEGSGVTALNAAQHCASGETPA